MGMAASQVRLLQLTSRKNTIGRNLQDLSLQKMSLSRDMAKVAKNYQNALNSKMLKWSNNAGVSYVDLSYSTLMNPNAANKNVPYLLTNTNGQVIVDSKYEKYAKMISENGAAAGNWKDNRIKILSELVGVSEATLEDADTKSNTLDSSTQKANTLLEKLEEIEADEPISKDSEAEFIAHAGTISLKDEKSITGYSNYDIAKMYKNSSAISLGSSTTSAATLKTLLSSISDNMKNYLSDDDATHFSEACNTYLEATSTLFDSTKDALKNSGTAVTLDGKTYKIDVKKMIDEILGSYCSLGGTQKDASYGTAVYITRDKNSTKWTEWKASYDAKKAEFEAAKKEVSADVDANNQVLTADQESKINFYDQLFTAIAEKGWECNYQVEDGSYLNEMLQNNQYFITTMKSAEDEDGKSYYEYDDSIASNIDNIVIVNDSDAQQEAQVEYEYQKSKISEKETRIDTRMQDLETEQSAINNMIKGIETVRNDNIERTMGIFA